MRQLSGAGQSGGERSLASYLALPRPGDAGKAVIVPLGFAVGLALTGAPAPLDVARLAVVWFAVEYLAYQARYQWNDIRGFWSDQRHPDRNARGRLPGPPERARAHITASATVAVGRVGCAVLLAVAIPRLHAAGVLITSVAAVFVVAIVYERVRAHAGGCVAADGGAPACVALWVVAGGGYCVRGVTGLVLAGVSGAPLVFAGAACWAAGIVFVTTRWAVESIPFARRHDGRLVWSADAKAGRGHLLPLSQWLPHESAATPDDLRRWRPMWSRRPWHAPWNLAFLVALAAAWFAGSGTTYRPIGFLVVAAVWVLVTRRPAVGTGALAGVLLLAVAALGGSPGAAVPAVVVGWLYLVCAHQNLDEVGTLYRRRIGPVVRPVVLPVSRLPQTAGR